MLPSNSAATHLVKAANDASIQPQNLRGRMGKYYIVAPLPFSSSSAHVYIFTFSTRREFHPFYSFNSIYPLLILVAIIHMSLKTFVYLKEFISFGVIRPETL